MFKTVSAAVALTALFAAESASVPALAAPDYGQGWSRVGGASASNVGRPGGYAQGSGYAAARGGSDRGGYGSSQGGRGYGYGYGAGYGRGSGYGYALGAGVAGLVVGSELAGGYGYGGGYYGAPSGGGYYNAPYADTGYPPQSYYSTPSYGQSIQSYPGAYSQGGGYAPQAYPTQSYPAQAYQAGPPPCADSCGGYYAPPVPAYPPCPPPPPPPCGC